MNTRWLGVQEYGAALSTQEDARLQAVAGGPPVLIGLEHLPVVTLGKRGGEVDPAAASAAGYAVWRTRRGGLATCHEPGQLVGYLVVDARALGPRRLVEAVEGVILDWLGGQGIVARRRAGMHGVWVFPGGRPAKIAAVGLQIRGGWTTHGFALNLTNSLAGFGLISPCGIPDAAVTSAARLGSSVEPRTAWPAIAEGMSRALCG